MPCLLKRSLLHVPRRTVTPENVQETVKRGMTLWNNIYEPHAEKLYNKLGSYHPDFICTCSECLPCLLVSDLVVLVHVFNPKSETPAIPFSRSAASHRSVLCCSGVGVDLLFMDTTPLLSLSFLGGALASPSRDDASIAPSLSFLARPSLHRRYRLLSIHSLLVLYPLASRRSFLTDPDLLCTC